MAQIAFSVCVGPCDFSYCTFLVNLAWLLRTALLFPEIIFFPLWHSKDIFRSLTTMVCGSILLVLLSGAPWVGGGGWWCSVSAVSLRWALNVWCIGTSGAKLLLSVCCLGPQNGLRRRRRAPGSRDIQCRRIDGASREASWTDCNPHCHSATSQLCLGTAFAGDCLE